jgi:hypothetical protein
MSSLDMSRRLYGNGTARGIQPPPRAGALQNFVFEVSVLVGGVFLALIIYGSLKDKDVDNPT